MAYLFKIENNMVYPNTETLLIEPFKSIWERDKTKAKNKAKEEFAYIEFMSSMKKTNPYRNYPEDRKEDIIIDAVITTPNWKPDSKIKEAIKKIQKFQTEASVTYNYLMSAKQAIESMMEFYNNVDLGERNFKTGNPIYKPRDVTSAINDIEKNMINIKNLEKKMQDELIEETRNKSDKEISWFANPETMEQINQ